MGDPLLEEGVVSLRPHGLNDEWFTWGESRGTGTPMKSAARVLDRSALIRRQSLVISRRAGLARWLASFLGRGLLLAVTSSSVFIVFFIFYFIIKDAVPFFQLRGVKEFFCNTQWYPSANPASFGALAILTGTALVTVGAIAVAVPLGVGAAVCLSDILPFALRQWTKPVIELLAAIPSVAFGFFALVVFAPALQASGGTILAVAWWLVSAPVAALAVFVLSDIVAGRIESPRAHIAGRLASAAGMGVLALWGLWHVGGRLSALEISSGTNALNASIILGIMALPTIISVSEDALQSIGRELREGAYALGATRAETMVRVVIPAARSGICAAVILGIMRALGETMVVLMASGNAAQIPRPLYNLLMPVRTLTATIAQDMGEADQVTGSARYHVLFAMALCLLIVSYVFNLLSESIVRRTGRKGKR
jgi:phosphate transport system permease protein